MILALGAMSFEAESEKEKLDMFVNAFRKTECRAVIQGFRKSLADYDLPDTMIAVGITAAIEEMNSTYAVKKRNAVSLSEKIMTENGLEEAVRLISDYF